VNNPVSERGPVLFGQAGTERPSIADEIAQPLDNMRRLTSSPVFLEPFKDARIVGLTLVVIDAFDESGDTGGGVLEENLKRPPSNVELPRGHDLKARARYRIHAC
jgi:hypothetical protein